MKTDKYAASLALVNNIDFTYIKVASAVTPERVLHAHYSASIESLLEDPALTLGFPHAEEWPDMATLTTITIAPYMTAESRPVINSLVVLAVCSHP